ncbi:MAG TPA: RseA family anti-sigma factor [Burkholderiaceae bacterium]
MNAKQAADAPAGSTMGEVERLSAWLDGELDQRSADDLLDRLLTDPVLQQRLDALCAAGDALRSHEVAACHTPGLCRKVSLALRDEPALLAPRALARARARRHVVAGVAVAAAAAVLVVVAVPVLRSGGAATDSPAARAGEFVQAPARDGGLAQQSGPTELLPPSQVVHNPRLDPYFQAHRDLVPTGMMPATVAYVRPGGEGDR